MTTAFLSVGLDTDPALKSLRALQARMRATPLPLEFSLNNIDQQVMKELHRRNFTVRLGPINLANVSAKMADQINNDADRALQAAFLKVRHVTFDHALLTTQVSAAVKAGLAGHVMPVGAVVAGGAASAAHGVAPALDPGTHAALQRTIQQTLLPAVDAMVKASLAITSAAKATGVARSAGSTGNSSARSSISAKDTGTGATIGVSTKLDVVEAEAQIASLRALKEKLDLTDLKATSAPRLDPRTILGLPTRNEVKAESDRLRAQMQGALDLTDLKSKSAPRLDASTLLGLPTRQEAHAASEQIRNQMLAEAKANADAVRAFYVKAKFDAEKLYTGKGAAISAAQQTAAKFGQPATVDFLGPNKSHLLGATGELENHLLKTRQLTGAQATLNSVMRDGHSAARGLAGSMNQMWLTWGNIAPLVAAAALGGAIRSIVMTGKELEYQLKFVSLLSDGAGVSVTEFGNSIKGLMVGPVEAGKAMRGLAQNGLEVGQALSALPVILRLATAGEMGLQEAALGATGVMEAFGLSVGSLGHVADVFTKAAAISNTSVSEMVEAMKQASTVSDNYRISLDETAATLAVLAQRNIRGTAAGTAFRNMISNLANPTKHAKDAMHALGLEIYDGANRIKPYNQVLSELSAKLSGVNEQSRNALLGAIFTERGFKGASALLSDLDDYREKLRQVKEESKDFTKKINEGLAETTSGKLKALMAEFETATTSAFYGADSALKNFTDSMRILVASEGFHSFLTSVTTALVGLTSALVENGKTIAIVLGVWAGFGISKVIVTSLVGMTGAFAGIEVAALGSATAMKVFGVSAEVAALGVKGFMASATLGLSLLITLGAEYLLLAKHTNDADEAQKAFNNNLDLQYDALTRSTEALAKESERLDRRNKLIREGKSLAEAERLSSKPKDIGKDDTVAAAKARLDRAVARKAQQELGDSGYTEDIGELRDANERAKEANAELKQATENYDKVVRTYNKAAEEFQTREANKVKEEAGAAEAAANRFNKRIDDAQKNNPKLKLEVFKADPIKASQMGKEAADEYLKGLEENLGKQLRTVTVPDPATTSVARSEDKSKVRGVIQGIRDEEAAMVQAAKFRKDLDAAKYNPNLFGQQIGAYLAEQRAIELTTENYKLEEKAIRDLKEVQKLPNLNKADRENIDTEIAREEAKLKLARLALQNQKEIADANSIERARQEAFNEKKTRSKLGADDAQELAKIQAAFELKVVDPAVAAQITAQLAVQGRYAGDIAKYADKVEETEAAIVALRERKATLSAEEQVSEEGKIEVLQATLGLDMSRLAILKAQAAAASTLAGEAAKKGTEQARTAEYGFNKFWAEYVDSAQSSAKLVEGIMKTSTDYMSTTFGNFVSGTQQDFKALTVSMLQDVTRMLANQMMQKFLMMAGNALMGSIGGSAMNGNGGYSYGGTTFNNPSAFVPVTGHAKGGVMTEYGNLPLRKYARGGVEHGPALSVHGEGSLPEANVPLQDGRTIPVTLKGAVGGNTNVQINVVNNGAPVKAKSTQRETPHGTVIDLVLDAVASDMANGGRVHDATQRRFGLNPGGSVPRY